ncbi:hypothetical protein OROGR_021758 [Orobanche gracilis]
MGEILTFSQSSFLLSRPSPLCMSRQVRFINCNLTSLAVIPSIHFSSRKQKPHAWMTTTLVISDSKVPTTFTVDSAGGGMDILPDSGGSGDDFGGNNGGGGGNDGSNEAGSGKNEEHDGKRGKKLGMSMSQKLTLGYAALVGIGGLMGYLKGGSKKSLTAGGLSSLVLLCVCTMLPLNPVLASSAGFGVSAALLGVMGLRFKKSGKIFPAGVVAFTSLVMSGGYLHGIMRSLH